jgi:hypothetical protein
MSTSTSSVLSEIISAFARATGHGPSFVGVTYTAKKTGETARYVFSIGTNYLNLLNKSLVELGGISVESELDKAAHAAVKASLEKSIAAHEKGEQSDDYTKKGMYRDLSPGVKEFNDGTCEIAGIQISRKVITPGVYKTVNSAPLTLAKQAIEKQLSKSKYKTLCIDAGNLESIRVGGNEIEVESVYTANDAKTATLSAPLGWATV